MMMPNPSSPMLIRLNFGGQGNFLHLKIMIILHNKIESQLQGSLHKAKVKRHLLQVFTIILPHSPHIQGKIF